jgi:hypothetical protein
MDEGRGTWRGLVPTVNTDFSSRNLKESVYVEDQTVDGVKIRKLILNK